MHMHPFWVLIVSFQMKPLLVARILEVQMENPNLRIIKCKMKEGLNPISLSERMEP